MQPNSQYFVTVYFDLTESLYNHRFLTGIKKRRILVAVLACWHHLGKIFGGFVVFGAFAFFVNWVFLLHSETARNFGAVAFMILLLGYALWGVRAIARQVREYRSIRESTLVHFLSVVAGCLTATGTLALLISR